MGVRLLLTCALALSIVALVASVEEDDEFQDASPIQAFAAAAAASNAGEDTSPDADAALPHGHDTPGEPPSAADALLPPAAAEDVFEDDIESPPQLKGATVLELDAAPRPTLATRDWSMEVLAALVVLAYMGWYIMGSGQNSEIQVAFVAALEAYVRSEYADASSAADDKSASPLTRLSNAHVQWWVTGRRHTQGLLMDLSLKHRQDAATGVMAALGQAPVTTADVLTLEWPLNDAPTGFVMALLPRADRKATLDANKDLKRFPTRIVGADAWTLKDTWEVLTESREIADAVLSRDLVIALNMLGAGFKLLHITDLADMSAISTQNMSVRALRVVIELPAQAAWETQLLPLLRALHALVDRLATMKLSKDAAERVKANRVAFQKELDKEAAVEAEEKRRAEKEKEREKERAARAALDRETRKKLEEKERKQAMKGAMPRMKFRAR